MSWYLPAPPIICHGVPFVLSSAFGAPVILLAVIVYQLFFNLSCVSPLSSLSSVLVSYRFSLSLVRCPLWFIICPGVLSILSCHSVMLLYHLSEHPLCSLYHLSFCLLLSFLSPTLVCLLLFAPFVLILTYCIVFQLFPKLSLSSVPLFRLFSISPVRVSCPLYHILAGVCWA